MEIYNYPGGYKDQNKGVNLAAVSRDVERMRNLHCAATGYAPTLTPGFKVKRTSTDQEDSENGDYLILRCVHSFGTQTYESDPSRSARYPVYHGAFQLSRSDLPYRMPQRTRKPAIIGTQSALVIKSQDGGPEIDVDKLGRILVQFYWDRKKKPSRRVRVAQFWAGSNRGALFVPRVGDEVLIAYDDGDPDRPIVVGSVYNGANTVPMTLPGQEDRIPEF